MLLCCCSSDPAPTGREDGGALHESHGKRDAAYDVVFQSGLVQTLRLVIAPGDYAAMQSDLVTLLGDGGGSGGLPPGGGFPPIDGGLPPWMVDGGFGDGGPPGGGGAIDIIGGEPIYVPVDVQFEGKTWYHAGVRYKGNSSLASLFRQGVRKLPFRIDFDEFEDRWPETKDQRFYGFQKLTFSSNFSDDSQVREALVAKLLTESGVPAARWAFFRIVIDVGKGDEYLGLYTAVEDPGDGAMLKRIFGSKDGNLYKPDGSGADWTKFDPAGFEKKTNEKAADFSDVQRAITALHADRSNAESWRNNLDTTFDTVGFLRWLAINTTVQNWDAYGMMAHNYYLYGVPSLQGKLVWIPWDHNLSLGATIRMAGMGPGDGGGFPGGGFPGGGGSTSQTAKQEFLHSNVSEARWPLIRKLLDDPIYRQIYLNELASFLSGPFAPEKVIAQAGDLHALVAPHILGEHGEIDGSRTTTPTAFEAAITGPNGLAAVIGNRHARGHEALGSR
jgi:spore coat protein H